MQILSVTGGAPLYGTVPIHGVVSHETGTAVVTLSADVANETLKKAVEDQDYKVTGIE